MLSEKEATSVEVPLILSEEIEAYENNDGTYMHIEETISKQEATLRAIASLEKRRADLEKRREALNLSLQNKPSETVTVALFSERFIEDALTTVIKRLVSGKYIICDMTLGISGDEFNWFVIGLACAQVGLLLEHLSHEERERIVDLVARARGVECEEEEVD